MVKTYSQLYLDARRALLKTGEDAQTASLYARNLLHFATGEPQEAMLVHQQQYASEEVCQKMEQVTARAVAGEPLAYILGEWDFYGLTLTVDKNVLIPRDDTCALTEMAIRHALFLNETPRILDLCTGSGCIGLAMATRLKDARVTLADVSREALAVAKKNVTNLKLSNRVSCVQVDALQDAPGFLGKFDMIVSNPPYVTAAEMAELPTSVADYEPHLALFGGTDGLDFYRSIGAKFKSALKPEGLLCVEFGMGQGSAVSRILRENGFAIVERAKDAEGRERAMMARLI